MNILKKRKIYLDYAGATPLDPKILKKMTLLDKDFFANPNSVFESGVLVRNKIEESRTKIAKLINAHSDEIIFTGSGTESCALSILGVVRNKNFSSPTTKIPHIITTEIEHPAVLENFRLLDKSGEAEVTYLPVDESGLVDLKILRDSLKENTILVSVMYANNEIGTIQPIEEIAKIIRHFKKNKSAPQGLALGSLKARPFPADFPVFHTDACQAMNYLPTNNIEKLGVDMMSFNSSKIYGPKGIGVLYKKRKVNLEPLYEGGGQERGLRSGTESAPLIVGVGEALELAEKMKKSESVRLTKIRDYAIEKLLNLSEQTGYNITLNGSKKNRLPNNINISVEGISSELLVIELSAKGIFVSEKSACKSDDDSKSYVIGAIRKNSETKNETEGSLRISLGRQTKREDMDSLVKNLKKILEKYKKFKNS